jgi:hypothetical protein
MASKERKSQDKSCLQLLTIILLSHRQKESIAALDYYKSLGVSVIFPAATQQFYQSVASFSRHGDQVLVLQPKSCQDDIYQRLSSCEPWIKTPYFIIASDDDMLLEEGLLLALHHLEANKTFANYYGSTVTALFKAPYTPIINPCYRLSNHLQHVPPEPANIFLRYRCYPIFYGVSRTQVFNTYLRLFPPSLDEWMGIWEFNYSIAVSMHGPSYYDANTPFLLRLVHRPSRSCLEDCAEAPRLNENPEEYLNRYVDTKAIDESIHLSGKGYHLDVFLRAIYIDVLNDAKLIRPSSAGPSVKFPLFPSLGRSIVLNLRHLISRPAYVFCYATFLQAAIKYYHARAKCGINLVM